MLPKWLTSFFDGIWGSLSEITFVDMLDILCLSLLFYLVYKFIRERRAGKLIAGIVFLVIILILTEVLNMKAMQFILSNVFQVGLISLVIIFQPELRSGLEKIGAEPIRGIRSLTDNRDYSETMQTITNVCEAVSDLADTKTGALIVFERSTKLGELILTGTVIDSGTSPFLIKNIFYKGAPLHDGALVIRDNKLSAAGCLLPLSTNPDIIKALGTRHRAAVGMSENSDAVIVVVSEETGSISVAYDGKLYRGFDKDRLANRLSQYLLPEKAIEKKSKKNASNKVKA